MEALIGIRMPVAPQASVGQLEATLSRLPDDYQTGREPITLNQTQLTLGAAGPDTVPVDRKQLGWRFGASNGKYAVKYGPTGSYSVDYLSTPRGKSSLRKQIESGRCSAHVTNFRVLNP